MTTTDDRPPIYEEAPPNGPRRRRAAWLVALAAVIAVVAALVVAGDDNPPDTAAPAATATTAAAPTTAPTTTPPPATADTTALWPFPGSSTRFATPEDAARSFATEYLRFEDPQLAAFQAGDTRSGEVPLRPRANGPVTTVLVRQVGPGDDWSVLGAVTENIDVTAPATLTEIFSPVRVTGRALAFEGNVQVEVRADGGLGPIGAGIVTGGGDVMRPFEGSIPFETPGAPYGALVLFTASAENGQVWEAAAFRVALRSTDIDAAACGGFHSPQPRPAAGEMVVKAYFSCDAEDGALRPAYRLVPESPQALRAALDALVAGPNSVEREASLGSWFSARTKGMVRSVTINDGHAVVDFDDLRPVIPNASTSAGSDRLLSQLDATVFQFRTVETVEYRIEGSCEDFSEWLQYGGCDARQRGTDTD